MNETRIVLEENGLYLVLEVTEERDVRLLHLSCLPFAPASIASPHLKEKFRLVELQITGENQADHHGQKHTGTMPGKRLRYVRHRDERTDLGRKLEVDQEDERSGLEVTSHFQFMRDLPVIRVWTTVSNGGAEEVGLEYVSTFALTGLGKEGLQPWERTMRVHVPHNTWYGEAQWSSHLVTELGLSRVGSFSVKRLPYTNTGTWSTSQWVPMGCLENEETKTSLFWQIEHNGSWHWELGDQYRHLYVQLGGPSENEHHWWKRLQPGETFATVPAAVGSVQGGLTETVRELTRYRRLLRRPHPDNRQLPVIFNDFMNCLGGDPTTEKLLPLIDAAAETGCEYFCIDCGWYADGHWWEEVGEWLPSGRRFPNGIEEPIRYIRARGMVPGLWLELEVMGIRCPLADRVPDDWFFCRHGKRVIDNGRYQLDYRNPAVREHADGVIRRLVQAYGVGYIKMDYNINAGIGTERGADSFGDGLLQHNRAYLEWLAEVMDRYPELIIENCGSGGQRMDYAMLALHPIQSVSDQDDYRKNAAVAAACPSVVTPEQAAIWSYPLREGDREEVVFNMVNAMLLRIHQSGQLAELSPERKALVREAIGVYKAIRADIPQAVPLWPLGMPAIGSPWQALALTTPERTYAAVWRIDSESDTVRLPFEHLRGRPAEAAGPQGASPQAAKASGASSSLDSGAMETGTAAEATGIAKEGAVAVRCLYPAEHGCRWQWHEAAGALAVTLPVRQTARLFVIEHRK